MSGDELDHPSLADFEGASEEELAKLPPRVRRVVEADRASTALAKVDLITADLTVEVSITEFDKTGWGPGPWQDEPDLLMWRAKTQPHYRCQIARNTFGSLNGYVAVPPGHPAHGLSAFDGPASNLSSHGGLTFAGPATAGHWVFGFDCGHAFDIQPMMDMRTRLMGLHPIHEEPSLRDFDDVFPKTEYRAIPYVRAIVEVLAAQLVVWAVTGEPPKDDDEEPTLPELPQ